MCTSASVWEGSEDNNRGQQKEPDQAALQALWNWCEDGLMARVETYPCGFVTSASSI